MINKLAKYQNYLIGLAIFISLSAVSITINNGHVNLNLKNYPFLMILLVLISIVLVLIYIGVDNYRIENLSKQIKAKSTAKNESFIHLVDELTTRQKTVFDLIVAGKSNKEIMAELFIEQSTLKSHINQIYKKLNIKSRKELKLKASLR